MRALLFIIIIFPNTAYAINDVHSLLLADDSLQLRQAAKLMMAGQQNNEKNADLLAEILSEKYQKTSANSTDIDAWSWACKALAATGTSRYKNLLEEIYQSDAHKKLRKYAKKSLNKLPFDSAEQFQAGVARANIDKTMNEKRAEPVIINIGVLPQIPSKQPDAYLIPNASLTQQERMLFAIAKGEWLAIKGIAQQFYSQAKAQKNARKRDELEILDALSQFLIENYLTTLDKQQIDVLAWICRAIGYSENTRYAQRIKEVSAKTTVAKIRKYAVMADDLLISPDNITSIKNIDFSALLNELKAQ